jgi:outer membrane protein|tara:strand:- start:159 stop:674 length:516 start_codon:yes stop_codon:yes gene_type:complete
MKKIILLFFLINIFNFSFAEEKILYLDVNYLLTESKVGKNINIELQKINNNNIEEFKKIEKTIKNEEDNLVKQKNILKEEQYGLKISELKNKYNSYQEFKNKKNNELKNLRDNAGNKVLKIINDILAKYANENNISLILEKKNVVIGKTELDISKEILKILNNEIRYIELK